MATGFKDLNETQRTPDRGLSYQSTPRVREAKFGDGYTQRTSYGLNSLNQSYSVAFTGRSKAEINAIVAFLEDKQGVESFEFTIPFTGDGVTGNEDETERIVRVICKDWSQTYTYDQFYDLTATFERVYEENAQQ